MEDTSTAHRVLDPSELFSSQVAIGSALTGTIFGATTGTIRGTTPVLFAAASAVQWTLLGSSFHAARTAYIYRVALSNTFSSFRGTPLRPISTPAPTTWDLTVASGVGGVAAGGITAAITRGPRNVVPGMLVFGLLGMGGQGVVNWRDGNGNDEATIAELEKASAGTELTPEKQPGQEAQNFLQRIANSKYTPGLRTLSDEEYLKMMEEKILRVDADIAIIDDRIAAIRDATGKDVAGKDATEERKGDE